MSHKLIKIKVNKEDTRAITSNVVNVVIGRFVNTYQKNVVDLNNSLASEDKFIILSKLQDVIDTVSSFVEDLENTSDLVSEIEDLREENTTEED
jgi:uncharacterized membrane protein